MKIAFFVSGFPVHSETFILTQIAGLLDRGHDVEICANEVHDPRNLHSGFRRYGLFARVRRRRSVASASPFRRFISRLWLLAKGIRYQPALTTRSLNFVRYGRKALSLDLLDMALHFSDRPQYDVAHCHFGPNGNDAALLRDLGVLRGRLVVTFHSYDVLAGIETRGRIYRRLVQSADAVHSISEYNRRSLESFGFDAWRIHHHPMGIEVGRFGSLSPARGGPARILTVARLAPAKGLEYALDALAKLHRERPELRWHYRVIGGGELLGALQARTARAGIAQLVEFAGPQDQATVRGALQEADIFLLPSLAEALPIAIMEAMASELPVIATDVGGVSELVRDRETGRLVPPADVEALTTALCDLLSSAPEVRRRLGGAGRTLVAARHDTGVVTERLIEHYRTLVAAENSGSGSVESGTRPRRAIPAGSPETECVGGRSQRALWRVTRRI